MARIFNGQNYVANAEEMVHKPAKKVKGLANRMKKPAKPDEETRQLRFY